MIRHLNKTQRLWETKLKKTKMGPWWASKGFNIVVLNDAWTRFNSLLYESYRPAVQAAVGLKRLQRRFRLVLKFPFSVSRICCSSTSLKSSLMKQTSSNKWCLFRSFLISSAAVCLVKISMVERKVCRSHGNKPASKHVNQPQIQLSVRRVLK